MSDTRFSEKVRKAAKALGEFTANELADEIGVMTYEQKKAVSAYIREFKNRGEMERVNPDGPAQRAVNGKRCPERYRYVKKITRITNRQRMWDVVRRMPTPWFMLQDLEQLTTGIKYAQVKAFCIFLRREGWTERTGPGKYRRVKAFPVRCPPDRRGRDGQKT